jgi:polyisoprenoid-binding protein YceI
VHQNKTQEAIMKQLIFTTLSLSIIFTACKKDKHDDVDYQVNSSNSVALWKGSTSATSNTGSFQVTSSSLVANNNRVVRGNFVIPIASVKNFNLPDDGTREFFLDHLKSVDFFNLLVHPNATFDLKGVKPYIGNGEDAVTGANQFITGDFNMIGKAVSISFPARVEFVNDSLKVEAKFRIDRTKWGMNYASDPAMGEHYINKDVEIHLKVYAGKK